MICRKSYMVNLFLAFYDTMNIKPHVYFNGFDFSPQNVVLPNKAQLIHIFFYLQANSHRKFRPHWQRKTLVVRSWLWRHSFDRAVTRASGSPTTRYESRAWLRTEEGGAKVTRTRVMCRQHHIDVQVDVTWFPTAPGWGGTMKFSTGSSSSSLASDSLSRKSTLCIYTEVDAPTMPQPCERVSTRKHFYTIIILKILKLIRHHKM